MLRDSSSAFLVERGGDFCGVDGDVGEVYFDGFGEARAAVRVLFVDVRQDDGCAG
jgi:hypothetical protein